MLDLTWNMSSQMSRAQALTVTSFIHCPGRMMFDKFRFGSFQGLKKILKSVTDGLEALREYPEVSSTWEVDWVLVMNFESFIIRMPWYISSSFFSINDTHEQIQQILFITKRGNYFQTWASIFSPAISLRWRALNLEAKIPQKTHRGLKRAKRTRHHLWVEHQVEHLCWSWTTAVMKGAKASQPERNLFVANRGPVITSILAWHLSKRTKYYFFLFNINLIRPLQIKPAGIRYF